MNTRAEVAFLSSLHFTGNNHNNKSFSASSLIHITFSRLSSPFFFLSDMAINFQGMVSMFA